MLPYASVQIALETGNRHKAKVAASLLLCDLAHQGVVRFVECNLSNFACVEVNQARCMAWNVVAHAAAIWLWGADARAGSHRKQQHHSHESKDNSSHQLTP